MRKHWLECNLTLLNCLYVLSIILYYLINFWPQFSFILKRLLWLSWHLCSCASPNCFTIHNTILKLCKLSVIISHRPTLTKCVAVPLKDPESIIVKTSYNFSTFIYLYTRVACTVCFMSPRSKVQNECLAAIEREPYEQKLKPQTVEDLVHCVSNGCVTRNWRKYAMSEWPHGRAAKGDQVISLGIDAWSSKMCTSSS